MSKPRHRDPCTSCGAPPHKHQAHGWCNACYLRWWWAGKPSSGPPPRLTRQADAIEDCVFLMQNGVTNTEALAQRLGVSVRAAQRYRQLAGQS